MREGGLKLAVKSIRACLVGRGAQHGREKQGANWPGEP
jgi:hypothetical protein